MAWLKKNIWIVTLSLVAVIAYPVGWYFSSGWNEKLRTDLQTRVDRDFNSVNTKVTYTTIQIDPNVPALELTNVAPNAKITEAITAIRERQQRQLDEIVGVAEDFNRRGRDQLVDGLFPKPDEAAGNADLKRIEINKEFVTSPSSPPSAYERLLDSLGAGPPVDPAELKDQLNDLKDRELARKEAADGLLALTPEESKELLQKLIDYRLSAYRRNANEVSLYADMKAFPEDRPTDWPKVFKGELSSPPVLWNAFLWQHDYWAMTDVIEAIGRANTDENGEFTAVTESPVKRIAKIHFTAPLVPQEVIVGGKDPQPGTVLDAGAQLLEPDFAYSITGRYSSPDNRLYDVRNVYMELIVSLEKLPRLFDALAQTNFMTITDIDLENIDVEVDLALGYFYGPDHVVKATMNVEVLLLRSWTEPFMPVDVQHMLGAPPPAASGIEDLNGGG